MSIKSPALIIHVGAGSYPKDLKRAKLIQKKLFEFCKKGYELLQKKNALETVTQVVRWLEDWPETNAGTGSLLQSDGKARLSASLMDGGAMNFSAVINVEQIKNPILVAKLLQKEEERVLSGKGAFNFARKNGFKPCDSRTKDSVRRWKKMKETGKYGTVGACALDKNGGLAAATSTGGRGMEQVGRVSDSAMPAGNFANRFAACSATGVGEDIINEALCSRLAILAEHWNSLGKSFSETFEEAKNRKRRFAAIGVDRKGNLFWRKTTEILYYAAQNTERTETFKF